MTNLIGRLGLVLGVWQLAACDSSPTDGTCFPVPVNAVARTGMETQGTGLQGEPPDIPIQGTGLQGEPPEIPIQGTGLQGEPPDIPVQGTGLQGQRPDEELQGTGLQGEPPEIPVQGRTLQGDPPGERDQGTGLQGERPEDELQGTRLQGVTALDAYRGLGDLNGARLALATGDAVTVERGELTAPGYADTAALTGVDLIATAADGHTFHVAVTGATVDGRIRHLDLYADGLPVCAPGETGVIVAGRWDANATFVDDPDAVTYSCASGVIAKCVTWGYAPWVIGGDIHAACTRLARADYCGDGTPWTLDGTHVQVFDSLGVLAPPTSTAMAFEAAWSPAGAVCVARTRYEVHTEAGDTLEPTCFATLPRCADFAAAAARGAVLANDSYVTPIAACE